MADNNNTTPQKPTGQTPPQQRPVPNTQQHTPQQQPQPQARPSQPKPQSRAQQQPPQPQTRPSQPKPQAQPQPKAQQRTSGRQQRPEDGVSQSTQQFKPVGDQPRSPARPQAPRSGGGGKKSPPRKPRAHTGCLTGILYAITLLTVAVFITGFGWQCVVDVMGFMKPLVTAEITIEDDYNFYTLTEELEEKGLINKSWLFRLFGRMTDAEEDIIPGTYTLRSTLDYNAMVKYMSSVSVTRETVRVTIPEGLTLEQIFTLLEDNEVASVEELQECADSYSFDYDFLDRIPYRANRLEGYLYPDTYDFYLNEDPSTAISKMLANFNRKLSNRDFQERLEEIDYTLVEIVTIASMVQNEAADTTDEEMMNISSVIYNRLLSPDFPYLQIDAAVQYALPERKARLMQSDIEGLDSPYNTYKVQGLPPGPISNPGVDAIRAALYPEETDYYYYALTDEGVHQFSRNLDEHNSVIANNPETYGNQ